MERRFRSPILAALLVLTLAAALLPVLSRSAQAAEVPLATTYDKTHYLNKDGNLVYGYRPFYSIDDAWEAARKGNPIKLTKDWDMYSYDGSLVVPSDEHITVYLDGHTIDRQTERAYAQPGSVFRVESNASLRVYGTGTLKGSFAGEIDDNKRGGAVHVNAGGTLIMDNVNVVDCNATNNGGGIWAIDGASVTLTNVHFSGCIAWYGTGGAVYVENASLTMDNCTFDEYNKSKEKDGIIALWDCTDVTLSNLTIDASGTYRSHGCVGVWATRSSFTLKDSTISNGHNSGDGDHYGGGLHIVDCPDARVENVTITDCDSEYGGGIYLDNSKVLLKDVTVDNCSVGAAGYGGGIYAYDQVSLTTENVTIQNCRASKYGGGIFLTNNSTINNTGGLTVKKCSAGEEGGGIYPKNGPDGGVTLDGVKIESCSSDGNGAGIFALNCKLTLKNCDIAYCQANDGGGIYASGNASETLRLQNGTEVHGCFANGSGGGIYTKGPEIQIEKDSEVRSNTAQLGGGVYFSGSAGGTVDGKVDSNYASKWGGGIYYNSGDVTLSSNASVQSNVAAMGGGGLCGESGTLTVKTNGIRNNNGAMAGGGIYIGGGTVTVGNNATLSDNQSQDGNGGGIFLNSGTLYLNSYATLSGNRAKQNGGGLYLNGGTFFTYSDVSFLKNSAVNGNGGGICFAGSPDYRLQYARLTDNTAGGNGGAIFYDGGKGSLTLHSVHVTDNHAAGQGGGACINKSDRFTVSTNTTVKDNTCGADKASKNIASNLYLTNGGLISGLNGNLNVYVGSDDQRSGGFYVASLSGSNTPDLTGLHASDPAFIPAATGVGRNLWGVLLVKAYSHVTVENGTIINGNGYYKSGDTVWVKEDDAPAGKIFDQWVADSDDVSFHNNPDIFNTWFTMPDHDVTVTATYKDLPRYTVTVNGGGSTTGGNSYYAGATVTITAPAQKETDGKKYSFKNWTGDNVTFTDQTATTTTFVMPDHAVTVTANYEQDITFISAVNLSVTAPEAGKTLVAPKIDLSDDSKYPNAGKVNLLSWQWQGTEGAPKNTTATCNSQYLLMVTLKAAENYQFPENVSVTFGGKPALSSTLNNGTLTAYYAFPKTGEDTVTGVTWFTKDAFTIKQGETPSLPGSVSITTKFGTARSAQVKWTPEPEMLTAAGTYTYTPTLVLPEGVSNPDNLGSRTVTITVKAPDPVGKITITPVTQENGTVEVTLSCATDGATIRYSIDGENWDTVNTTYTAPFTLGSELVDNGGSDAYVLRVIASKDGYADRKDFTTIGVDVKKPSYPVTITGGTVANGKTDFEQGTLVGIKATPQDGKVFQKWTGNYVGAGTGKTIDLTFGDADAATTTFTMPKAPVSVTAHFVDMLDTAALTMDAPTSGVSLTLPEKATYNDSKLPISWTTQGSGDDVNCTATITIPADLANDRYFASAATATINGDKARAAVSDGSLTVTKTYTLIKPTGPLYSVTLLSTTDGEEQKLGDYPAGSQVTITAPEFENYRFAMWMGVLGSKSNEDLSIAELTGTNNGTVTFIMPEENIGILALYNSLVTGISFEIPAPEVGKQLVQHPTKITVTLANGSSMTLDDEETLAEFPISWDTTDEKAVFGKQYTAIVFATEGEKGNMTPMADGMTVKVNGDLAGTTYSGKTGAYYVRTNDAVQVFNIFPATSATLTELPTLEPIHNIEPGAAYSSVGLPEYVEVKTSCGPMAVQVKWSASGNTPTDQEFVEVTGTLTYPAALQIPDGTGNNIQQCIYLDKKIVVPATVETPTAVPMGTGESGSAYEDKVEVTLFCATPEAVIYYTTNGDTPTTSSTPYDGPITLTEDTTIKAIAVKEGMTASDMAEFSYTVYKTYSVYYKYGETTYLNGKYKAGDEVTVTATDLPGKTFQSWTAEGIDLGDKATQREITFSMPENEVTLTPQYNENSAIITALNFSVERLAIGQALPSTATYTAETSAGVAASGSVDIAWSAGGSAVASGATVVSDQTYTAVIRLDGSNLSNRIFSGQPRLSVMSPERNTTARATLNSERSATVTFQCTAAKPKLQEIRPPAALTGLPNGITLDAIKEKLGATITLVTDNGETTAPVSWSAAAEGAYDPNSIREQTFTLTGTVAIPDNIDDNGVSKTITVSVTVSARGFVGAPVASVAAGRYSTAQSVELSSLTPEATIYYTTDGTEPTAQSTPYTAPIQVSTDTTLKAIAMKNGMSNSIVSTYVYTFRRSGGHSSSGGQTNPGGQTKPGYASCSKGDTCPLAAFSDLVPTAWYHNGIHYCLDNGLMSGYGNGIFAPSDTFNRAMMVQVFYNMEKRPAQNSQSQIFDDVADGQWYSDAVCWASANGITTGYGKTFGPNDAVTREQVAQFLYNFARFKGYDTTARAALSAFTDGSNTSSWAQTAMQWAVATGVLNGKGDGILDPAATATRAEVATMLTNFCEKAAK